MRKIDRIKEYLFSFAEKPIVIGLCKTWFFRMKQESQVLLKDLLGCLNWRVIPVFCSRNERSGFVFPRWGQF